jgi:hypothetical protein
MATLPEPFLALEPYIEWSLSTERERIAKRVASSMDEIIQFHNAISLRLEEIIEYLNQYHYAEMPEDAQRLCDMALSLVEVCNLVEMYKNPAILKMVNADRFETYQ